MFTGSPAPQGHRHPPSPILVRARGDPRRPRRQRTQTSVPSTRACVRRASSPADRGRVDADLGRRRSVTPRDPERRRPAPAPPRPRGRPRRRSPASRSPRPRGGSAAEAGVAAQLLDQPVHHRASVRRVDDQVLVAQVGDADPARERPADVRPARATISRSRRSGCSSSPGVVDRRPQQGEVDVAGQQRRRLGPGTSISPRNATSMPGSSSRSARARRGQQAVRRRPDAADGSRP